MPQQPGAPAWPFPGRWAAATLAATAILSGREGSVLMRETGPLVELGALGIGVLLGNGVKVGSAAGPSWNWHAVSKIDISRILTIRN